MADSNIIIVEGKEGYHVEITKSGGIHNVDDLNFSASILGNLIAETDVANPFPGERHNYFYAEGHGLASVSSNIGLLAKLMATISAIGETQAELRKIYIINAEAITGSNTMALLTRIPSRSYTSAFSSAFK